MRIHKSAEHKDSRLENMRIHKSAEHKDSRLENMRIHKSAEHKDGRLENMRIHKSAEHKDSRLENMRIHKSAEHIQMRIRESESRSVESPKHRDTHSSTLENMRDHACTSLYTPSALKSIHMFYAKMTACAFSK